MSIFCKSYDTLELNEVIIWSSLNAELNPEEKQKLLDGTFFNFTCECGYIANLVSPLLYHDMTHQVMVYFVPESEVEKAEKSFSKIGEEMLMDGYRKRIVTNHNSLREKALLFNDGLDDRLMEIIKVFYYSYIQKQHPEGKFDELLFYKKDDKWFLQFIGEPSLTVTITAEFYQMVYDTFGGTLKQTEDKELYVTFDWAVKYIEQNTAEK